MSEPTESPQGPSVDQQAWQIIVNACERFPGTLSEHQTVQQAIGHIAAILNAALSPVPESNGQGPVIVPNRETRRAKAKP